MGLFSFFKGGEGSLDQVEHEVLGMIASCRHSLDLAMSALVTDADITPTGDEVRANDRTINAAEETVRRELVVHAAVTGSGDIGTILSFLLVVKKLERVGDQAKNIFDLADEGVRFSGADDYDQFVAYRDTVSRLFAEASSLIDRREPEVDHGDFAARCQELMDGFDELVNGLLHTDRPGSHAVPRAMLYRYLKRIVANLVGVVTTLADGIDRTGDDDADLDE